MKTTGNDIGRTIASQSELQQSSPPPPANPDAPDTAQALELLREVSILASMAIRLSRDRPSQTDDPDQPDDDDRDDRIQLLRRTLDRIGWVADVAERMLGGTGAFARAEDWMLPGV